MGAIVGMRLLFSIYNGRWDRFVEADKLRIVRAVIQALSTTCRA